MSIEKVLVLSTDHMPSSTPDWDKEQADTDRKVWDFEYGFVIFVPYKDNMDTVPEWLIPIAELAQKEDCTFICFDQAVDCVDGLPVYEWGKGEGAPPYDAATATGMYDP